MTAPIPSSDQSIPEPLSYIARFERMAYGLFLHWGLYSIPAKGEWLRFVEKRTTGDYGKLIERFDASRFDARAIARFARESGMRYITLTTRHHEGFSLYDTRGLSSFDAMHSPAKRDLVAEFVEGCRAEGIIPFFYHTTIDWTWDTDNCDEIRFADYLDYLRASVEILCRHYGQIGGFWFDGNWARPKSDWKEDRLYAMIRRYQPEALIINNTSLSARGVKGHPELDSLTFEQGLPRMPDRRGWPKYLAGEMCETMNYYWGAATHDFELKSPARLIESLCACRKVGANLLLNIGPCADGSLPYYEEAAVRKTGEWIAHHGDLLYAARPAPGVKCAGTDFVMEKEGRYYYFAHDLIRDGDPSPSPRGLGPGLRSIDGIPVKIGSVRWLDDDSSARYTQSADRRILTIDCAGYAYGYHMVVRVAELIPK